MKGAVADLAAKALCRMLGLLPPSSWSVRLMREAGTGTVEIPDGERRYRLAATSPLLLWRAKTILTKEPETVEWIRTFSTQDVFFDIGANVGMYTVLAGSRGARVFAFEPESANFAALNRNIGLNGLSERAKAYSIAIAESMRLDTLRLSQLEVGGALHAFGTNIDFKGETFTPVFHQGALSVSLDELVHRFGLPQPTQIKIDVDGLEGHVIAGALRVIQDGRLRGLLVEINESKAADLELVHLLRSKGFEISAQGAVVQSGGASMRNVVLKRRA